jgi:heptosyltransferase III
MAVNNILFITLSNIGDVIMTTPTLMALHQAYPGANIDIVADARSSILFEHCPFKGQLFLKDKKKGWRGTLALIKQLRKKRYDLAVDLRSDGLLYLLKAKVKRHKLSNEASMHMHSVEKHFAALQTFPVALNQVASKVWVSEKELLGVKPIQETLASYGKSRVLALGLGANFDGKIWPVNQFAALANLLVDVFDVVLLLGNQQDAMLSQQFVPQCQLPVVDCCGQLDLLHTTALLGTANYFVGNDSGLGHIASAMGVPSFTVFGVGQPHRYRPWGVHAHWYQDPQHEIKHVAASMIAEQIKIQVNLKHEK